jgi:hypothetical protein
MDVQAIRERLLTGFKPKEQDISTPYLEELDGELKLVGLTGKQRIALEEQATTQIINRDGTTTNKFNPQKFTALAAAQCLRLRSTGEKIFNPADVLGESGDGDGALFEIADNVIRPLFSEIANFIGSRTAAETKNASEPTSDGSDTTSSLQGSGAPLTNSLEASTAQS